MGATSARPCIGEVMWWSRRSTNWPCHGLWVKNVNSLLWENSKDHCTSARRGGNLAFVSRLTVSDFFQDAIHSPKLFPGPARGRSWAKREERRRRGLCGSGRRLFLSSKGCCVMASGWVRGSAYKEATGRIRSTTFQICVAAQMTCLA